MEITSKRKYTVSFGGMCWPCPSDAMNDLEWLARHRPESISEGELLIVASVIEAYTALIGKPQKKRNEICKILKDAHHV